MFSFSPCRFSPNEVATAAQQSARQNRPLFEDSSLKAIRAAHRRKWTAILTIVALVLTGAGVWIYTSVQSSREKTLTAEFMALDNEYGNIAQAYSALMQSFKDKPPVDIPEPDFSPVASKYLAFFEKHQKHSLGWQAGIKAAGIYLNKGQYSEALSILEPLSRLTYKHLLLQVRVRRTLAGIYMDRNELDKALAEINFLEKVPENLIAANVKLLKAQVLHLKEDKAGASKLLQEVIATGDPQEKHEAELWRGYWSE